ncbi:DMT family transporter [Halomonas citrativorans]|uniref:DMT family transporter n=1 Tax=Halomonas citrativorans TaxID=2742612 RepID=UPI002E1F3D07
MAHGSVAVGAALMYSAPVFVYLVSFALRLESPTPLKWAAIAVVLLGGVLLTRIYDIGAIGVTAVGVGAGLLARLSYAIFIFGFKYAAPHGSPRAILSIALTVLATNLIWPRSDVGQAVAVLGTPGWPLFAVLGVLGAGLSFVLYNFGLHHTAPAVPPLWKWSNRSPRRCLESWC